MTLCSCVCVHTCVCMCTHVNSEARGFWLRESGQLALPHWLPTDPRVGQWQRRAYHSKVEARADPWEAGPLQPPGTQWGPGRT